MKKILVRSLSGIVYIALVVGALVAGGWWIAALAALFAILGTIEYNNLTTARTGVKVNRGSGIIIDLAYATSMIVEAGENALDASLWFFALTLLYLVARMTLLLVDTRENAPAATAWSIAGQFYITLPLTAMTWVGAQGHDFAMLVLAAFVMIWLNDTGAFCVGSMIGKRRLCERLSPKKSWEGFWGGMAITVIGAAVFAACTGRPVIEWAVLGVGVSVLSTWGDLYESLLKRTAGVKDSGHIMPGHGGVLDRIDSFLFVMPVLAAVILLWPDLL